MKIFVSATEFCRRDKSHKFCLFDFLQHVAATKFCCRDKDFHKIFSSTLEAICRRDVSSRHVGATCRLV